MLYCMQFLRMNIQEYFLLLNSALDTVQFNVKESVLSCSFLVYSHVLNKTKHV